MILYSHRYTYTILLVVKMNTDIIIIKTDIVITDDDGNKVEVNSYSPELLELWV